MLLLVLVPAVTLGWSSGGEADTTKAVLIAAYCLLACHFAAAQVVVQRPSLTDRLAVLLLLAGNLTAAASLFAWGLEDADGPARLVGIWGLDNPVHASVLLLGSTLPTLTLVWAGRRPFLWLATLALPVAFVLLAGARTAAAAYLLVVLALVGVRRPRAAAWVVAAALASVAVGIGFIGVDRAVEIWLARGLSFRDVVWAQVWSAYQSCPALVGCGIGTPLTVEFAGVRGERAHSVFLAALYHQGLLGLLTFLGALGWLLVRGFRSGSEETRGWAWMLGYVLLANVTSGDHVLVRGSLFWACFWIPVLALAARTAESSAPARP